MAEAAAQAQARKAFPVSWDQFHRDARALAWRLSGAGPFEAIVCVTRGGLVPAAIVSRELEIRLIETVCVASYHDYKTQGSLSVLKGVADSIIKIGGGSGQGVLIVDDLVDTGKTAKIVRDILPKAHFATVYAKPMGRPMVDTFITEVSQDTWIYFPWDLGLSFQPPIRNGGGVSSHACQGKRHCASTTRSTARPGHGWFFRTRSRPICRCGTQQARDLSGAFRVLRYDQRGHGKTEAPAGRYTFDILIADALALMDALGIERAGFCGLSMGGATALGLAQRHPDRIERAIVCDSGCASTPQSAQQWEERIVVAQKAGMAPLVEPTVARWFPPDVVANNPPYLDTVRAMIRDTPVNGFIGCAAALADHDFRSAGRQHEAAGAVHRGREGRRRRGRNRDEGTASGAAGLALCRACGRRAYLQPG